MPKKSVIRKFVTRAFKQIKDRQLKNGSFGMYSSYDRYCRILLEILIRCSTNYFVTCYIAISVGICKEKGFSIPGNIFTSWLGKLEKFLENIETSAQFLDTDHK